MVCIIIYSKPRCGKCEAAKAHLKKMGFLYQEKMLADFLSYHEGWRDDESRDIISFCCSKGDPNKQLPTISVDGSFFTYSEVMKLLKAIIKSRGQKPNEGDRKEE